MTPTEAWWPLATEVPESKLATAVAATLNVTPRDERLWLQALTHASYVHEHPQAGPSYERLEFLGDALIGAAVAELLYGARAEASEGELTFLRSTLVRKQRLAAWLESTPLAACVRLGAGARNIGASGRATILADVAEAIFAALYLETDWPTLLRAASATLVVNIPDYLTARRELEPKGMLQELLVARGDTAQYRVVAYEPQVKVRVSWSGGSAVAVARSKREAEVAAARRALALLETTAADPSP